MADKVADKPVGAVGVWSATLLGVGAMVGAGIFALMGEAGAVAGNAAYLSFLFGGAVALLSGYSLARLGARYPAAGGIVEYLVQAYGEGVFSGGVSIVLYVAALVSLTLVAQAFGSYAGALFFARPAPLSVDLLAAAVILLFLAVNLRGAGKVAVVENVIVAVKLGFLVAFAAAGLAYLKPELLAPQDYPPGGAVLASIGVTFFAYEGFRVITNAAEDMPQPSKTLPRAIFAAILVVMLLYVVLAVALFGNLPVARVVEAKEYALAEAARPAFGATGFTVVAVMAMISTASAINAGLYAATNVTYQLAKDGELPQAFGRPIGRSREGLLISSAIIIVLVFAFDLGQIAVIGSVTVLLVHAVVHVGHLTRLRRETGASAVLLLLAVLANAAAVAFVASFEVGRRPGVLLYIACFVAAGFAAEFVLQRLRRRTIKGRTPA